MFSLLSLFLQQTLAEILIQDLVNAPKGIYNYPLTSFCENLPPHKQLKISLTQQSLEMSILAICSTQLDDSDSFEQVLSQNDHPSINCLLDQNAYILRNKTQIIFLQNNNYPALVSQYHKIFQINRNPCFAVISSKSDSKQILTVESFDIDECAEDCKNNGICVKGFCQCPLGYVGQDCDIITTNIEQNNYFFGFQIQYLDLIALQSVDYIIELNSELSYSILCYANSSHLFTPNQKGKTLMITENQINFCKQQTSVLQQQTQVNYYSQFIFVTNTSKIVQYSLYTDEQQSMIIVFIVLATILGVVIIIITVIYILKLKNTNKQKESIVQIENIMPAQQYFTISDRKLSNKDEQSCSICLERFKPESIVIKTYCEHIFHVTCLQNWMKKIKICPLCRAALDTVTIQSQKKIEQQHKQTHVLQQLIQMQKQDGSLNSIDRSLTYQSPKHSVKLKHSKFLK